MTLKAVITLEEFIMDKAEFSTKIKNLATQIESFDGKLKTEEATKNALIMPFFANLGYNVFDPTEFVPEFTADFGSKKGERVDYAIVLNDEVRILIETKELTDNLLKRDSQLFRYFTATKAKFGILTNGDTYKFYTDLESQNVMDKTPFLTIKTSEINDNQISELFKFSKENFDVDNITDSASDLKYIGLAKEYLQNQMKEPNEEFVRLILSNIYDKIKTQQVIEQFTPIISKAFNQIVSEQVSRKLSNALDQSIDESAGTSKENKIIDSKTDEIITTPEELESYTVAKVVLRDTITPNRIVYRDNRSYFNVLVDDSNRKWIMRIYFNKSRHYFVLHDDSNSEIDFDDPTDIYKSADKIIEVAKQYM